MHKMIHIFFITTKQKNPPKPHCIEMQSQSLTDFLIHSYSFIFILFLVNIVDQSLTVNNFLHERRERLALI